MEGRALTPEQKRAIVERIVAAWLRNPSLRLGQMIYISVRSPIDLFNVEDDTLAKLIEDFGE